MPDTTTPVRFRDRHIRFANGAAGRSIEIASANPRNYHQLVSDPGAMPPVTIDGKLFLPPGATGRVPVVMVVPGSLSVAPSHLAHAETFNGMGFASFVLDPFGARGVTSTVANQTQFSFAASALDVMRAVRALSALPEIDPARIGLQGHSRGGSAVLMAAMTRLNAGQLGGARIRAVLAGYPWCGHQPVVPDVGGAEIRTLIGDRDEWCSAQQAQGFTQAIRLRGGAASIRIVPGAAHSFDRREPIQRIDNASVAPGAPTAYLANDGAMIHPATGVADPALTDRDVMIYGIKAGYGVKGATIGSRDDQADLFRDDMMAFFGRTLAG
ncbi:MAG: dienelactone hydrolase family protein [Rhodospirillales bacterium]|nr:MAG: dienelactone hydrolase family protein [Rhodospirillales bacterium]